MKEKVSDEALGSIKFDAFVDEVINLAHGKYGMSFSQFLVKLEMLNAVTRLMKQASEIEKIREEQMNEDKPDNS
jgi:hypothetical protein